MDTVPTLKYLSLCKIESLIELSYKKVFLRKGLLGIFDGFLNDSSLHTNVLTTMFIELR